MNHPLLHLEREFALFSLLFDLSIAVLSPFFFGRRYGISPSREVGKKNHSLEETEKEISLTEMMELRQP